MYKETKTTERERGTNELANTKQYLDSGRLFGNFGQAVHLH